MYLKRLEIRPECFVMILKKFLHSLTLDAGIRNNNGTFSILFLTTTRCPRCEKALHQSPDVDTRQIHCRFHKPQQKCTLFLRPFPDDVTWNRSEATVPVEMIADNRISFRRAQGRRDRECSVSAHIEHEVLGKTTSEIILTPDAYDFVSACNAAFPTFLCVSGSAINKMFASAAL